MCNALEPDGQNEALIRSSTPADVQDTFSEEEGRLHTCELAAYVQISNLG